MKLVTINGEGPYQAVDTLAIINGERSSSTFIDIYGLDDVFISRVPRGWVTEYVPALDIDAKLDIPGEWFINYIWYDEATGNPVKVEVAFGDCASGASFGHTSMSDMNEVRSWVTSKCVGKEMANESRSSL